MADTQVDAPASSSLFTAPTVRIQTKTAVVDETMPTNSDHRWNRGYATDRTRLRAGVVLKPAGRVAVPSPRKWENLPLDDMSATRNSGCILPLVSTCRVPVKARIRPLLLHPRRPSVRLRGIAGVKVLGSATVRPFADLFVHPTGGASLRNISNIGVTPSCGPPTPKKIWRRSVLDYAHMMPALSPR